MFFKRKSNPLQNDISKVLEKMSVQEEILLEVKKKMADQEKQSSEIEKSLLALQSTVKRHDMTLEDVLDEWEEDTKEQDVLKRRISEMEQSEEAFLRVFSSYQEFFFRMKQFMDGKDAALSEQVRLMEQKMGHDIEMCGIHMLDQCDVPVDYDFHEVLNVVQTEKAEADGKVIRIFSPGFLYKGKVWKKAQVEACRMDSMGKER